MTHNDKNTHKNTDRVDACSCSAIYSGVRRLIQYEYDDLGNLLKEISPDRGTVNYAYDAAGNLTQQTDARGTVSTYSYDALNRLTLINKEVFVRKNLEEPGC